LVLTRDDPFGGGFPGFGRPVNGNGEPTLEELDPETVKSTIETLKKFFPYIFAFGVAALVKHFR